MRLLKSLKIDIDGTIISLQFDREPPIKFDTSVNNIDFNTSKNVNYIVLHCAYYAISVACRPENIVYNGEKFSSVTEAFDKISVGVSDMVIAGNTCDYNLVINKPKINNIELKDNVEIPAMFWDTSKEQQNQTN